MRSFVLFTLIMLALAIPMSARAEDEALAPPRTPPKTRAMPPKGAPKKNPDGRSAALQAEQMTFAPGLTRIKDIAEMQGVRGNQLTGYGLVVGLEGTGDGQNSQFTVQSLVNMLKRFGVTIPQAGLQLRNVAAVMVTADLPAFAKPGSHIDVVVSSMGDAKSLQGGTLVQTPLRAANGDIYAVAQGPLSIGGFNFQSGGSSVQKNFVNVGRIPRGAYVEQAVPTTLLENNMVQVTLHEADFTTASRVAEALRKAQISAQAMDASTVAVSVPPDQTNDLISFISRIESVSVTPDVQARIVINERTGTVVMGGAVRLAPGSVFHGAINIRVENTPVVIPAAPFNPNPGQVVPLQDTKVTEKKTQIAPIPATTTVDQLIRALNALGVTPRELISILQGMQGAGMINAQIEVQ